jgi:DNA-binding MarR family transcriptional regulator
MAGQGSKKAAVLQALGLELRRMSAQGVLLSSAVAERLGLSSSDLECLDVVMMAGPEPVTPGQLGAATALSSGAVTGVVDRLEKAGFVRREPDPADRRRVRIVPVEPRVRELAAHYERLGQRMQALWSQYTEEQLRVVLDFARRSVELSVQETARIRQMPAP